MPHSTFFSTPPPPIPEARPLPLVNTSLPIRSSSDFPASLKSPKSPIKPSPALSPPRKRFLLTTHGHGRSKSASAAMSLPPTSIPSLTPPSPTSSNIRRRSREYSPPLLRSTSLPLVIPEGKQQPSLMMTPPTPTIPPMIHNLSGISRSASPTRIYASSLSPAGIRSGYHPGSSFSPRAPSPPSYLVNEPMYPSSSASSSSPSTPTSLRSRSPSISSLETIPDTPDAEQEAVEAELKEAMERKASGLENEDEDDSALSRRRRSMDFERGGSRWGPGDKRKRWSVCGGEKRGDLDLETIWEEVLNTAEANNITRRADTEDEEDDEEDEDEDEDEIEEAIEDDEGEHDQDRDNDEDGENEDDEGIIREEP